MSPPFWSQHGADVRLGEGQADLAAMIGATGAVGVAEHLTVVIVDVLSFSTSTCIAVNCGASVLPLRERPAVAPPGVLLAAPRSLTTPSLSPSSLQALPAGTVLGLASSNGAHAVLTAASCAAVATGCLRNATAVADWALAQGRPVLLLAAGERWPGGALRPAVEDRLVAGLLAALLADRGLSLSAEARGPALAARSADIAEVVRDSASGRELAELGFGADVTLAVERDVAAAVPVLDPSGRLIAVR